ncbi:MAG: toxin-antitoxin system HicB family antitoxin [Verrucomicrobiota bacterium]
MRRRGFGERGRPRPPCSAPRRTHSPSNTGYTNTFSVEHRLHYFLNRSSGKFVLRLEPALHRRLAVKALAAGESLNNFCAKKLAKA